MKKFVSLVLALALCAGLAAPAMAAEFTDVPAGHAFYDAIVDCVEKGVAGGYSDGTFRPANTVTKNHFCAMLARAFYPGEVTKFDTDQYRNAYGTFGPTNVALANNGTLDNTSFRYDYGKASIMGTGISRYDMAQFMANIMKEKGLAVSDSEKKAAQARSPTTAGFPTSTRTRLPPSTTWGSSAGTPTGPLAAR